ncbi:MAG TPA: hypothetical protein VNL91_02550 [Thermoanaerobaculia bacterium]|nr:hypothetical protein [Thermoanaerobaculia bacterium]
MRSISLGIALRTFLFCHLFAIVLAQPAGADPATASDHHRRARQFLDEAASTRDPIRLLWLGWRIREALDAALALDPERIDARLDLVRFHTMAPRIAGGSREAAEAQAAEIERRDPALGCFARGYIAYRKKAFGLARAKLREAVSGAATAEHRIMALTWLGWLSQESQQYDDAFAAFESILRIRPTHAAALYEIGRTAVFARRDLERGERALRRFIDSASRGQPGLAEGHLQLALLLEIKGDRAGARRAAGLALRLDPRLTEAREVMKRTR